MEVPDCCAAQNSAAFVYTSVPFTGTKWLRLANSVPRALLCTSARMLACVGAARLNLGLAKQMYASRGRVANSSAGKIIIVSHHCDESVVAQKPRMADEFEGSGGVVCEYDVCRLFVTVRVGVEQRCDELWERVLEHIPVQGTVSVCVW